MAPRAWRVRDSSGPALERHGNVHVMRISAARPWARNVWGDRSHSALEHEASRDTE
jgi:hypothetical protein